MNGLFEVTNIESPGTLPPITLDIIGWCIEIDGELRLEGFFLICVLLKMVEGFYTWPFP